MECYAPLVVAVAPTGPTPRLSASGCGYGAGNQRPGWTAWAGARRTDPGQHHLPEASSAFRQLLPPSARRTRQSVVPAHTCRPLHTHRGSVWRSLRLCSQKGFICVNSLTILSHIISGKSKVIAHNKAVKHTNGPKSTSVLATS